MTESDDNNDNASNKEEEVPKPARLIKYGKFDPVRWAELTSPQKTTEKFDGVDMANMAKGKSTQADSTISDTAADPQDASTDDK